MLVPSKPEIADIARYMRQDHATYHSWKIVGDLWGVTKPMAYRIALKGYEPHKPEIRIKLGLPNESSVVVIFGSVPAGSQALYALRCECGQFFIPNHPRRKHCFLCSPFRKAGKHETRT